MSEPSSWPLSSEAIRVKVPKHMLIDLAEHALSGDCFTTAIGYYPHAKSHYMRRTEHDDYIMLYCVDGRGYLNSDAYSGSVKRGDLFILPPGTTHDYQADSQVPWSLFWCHFRGDKAKDYLDFIRAEATGEDIFHLHELSVLSRFNELVEIARGSYSLSGFVHASSQLRLILTQIERILHGRHKENSGIILPNIQQYMRANLDKNLNLDDLASLSHLSKYHFSRKYHSLTGFSPLQHFTQLKMEHACFLLEQENLSVSDVAFELGYDDALYFSRVFRKVNHISPSQYRKKLDC